MSSETIVSLIFGVLTFCATAVGCTWTLCDKLGKLVTQNQCAERRSACTGDLERKRKTPARRSRKSTVAASS